MEEHDTLISVRELFKSYFTADTEEPTEVLKDVNLDINSTDFAIIYGASGSGKSTLLHHIVGLEKPTRGKITVRGTEISAMTDEERALFRAEKFGIVYQQPYWVKALSVIENVALPLMISGCDANKAKEIAYEKLENIGLTRYATKRPMQLSGGEQQRIGLARALVNNPWILVADEPTGNLDTHSSDQVMQLFQELNSKLKRTIIMVTHNLIYLPMATKKIAMKDGAVVTSELTVQEQIREELKGVL